MVSSYYGDCHGTSYREQGEEMYTIRAYIHRSVFRNYFGNCFTNLMGSKLHYTTCTWIITQ